MKQYGSSLFNNEERLVNILKEKGGNEYFSKGF